jgi:hypothetical protein
MQRLLIVLALLAGLACVPSTASAVLAFAPATLSLDPGRAGSSVATVSVPGTADVNGPVLSVTSAGPGAAANWVTIFAPAMGVVSPPVDVAFTVTVTPPPGTPSGTYAFALAATAGGVEVGRASLSVTVTAAAASTGAGGAVSLRAPKLRGVWHESLFFGTVALRGTAESRATLNLSLSGPAGTRQLARRSVAAGTFNRTFPLPVNLLPGAYTLRVDATPPGGTAATTTFPLTLKAPPEGIVRRAYMSASSDGPPATSLAVGTKILYATFRFIFPPRGELSIGWTRDGEPIQHPAGKLTDRTVQGTASSIAPLPRGRYVAILRAGGRIVARASIRLT